MKRLLSLFLIPVSLSAGSYEIIPEENAVSIESPSLAERQTAKIKLANGLEALIISDPNVQQSAAALAVEAGSWQDPVDYPGMAHFLEHMLFMGTKAYPGESEYMQYIGDHGGKVNAYTASDRTVYMFSINNGAFSGALDRFSHFFKDPLFKQASIQRELHAVDQEHAKNLENDGWRQWMVFKETGNPAHPNVKFSTGNAATLKGIPRARMVNWYENHYKADLMHLVILSSLPLDQLIAMTTEDFSGVVPSEKPIGQIEEAMTSTNQQGHIFYLKPVRDLKQLSIAWEVDASLATDQERKAGELIAYVLQSGMPGGLLSRLKEEHLAEKVESEVGAYSKTHKVFSIDLTLTDEGLARVDDVIGFCFEALGAIKREGIPSYIFEEVKALAENNYRYQSRKEAFEFVMEQADAMVYEPLSTYPQKSLIPSKYDPAFVKAYLKKLTPENGIYFVLASPEKTGKSPTQKEQWMGAEYTSSKVSQNQLNKWRQEEKNSIASLPAANPYVAEKLTLKTDQKHKAPVETPKQLVNSGFGSLYFAQDHYYLIPEVAHYFEIKSPHLNGGAKSKALADLYIKILLDTLSEELLVAKAAGLKTEWATGDFGIRFRVAGYSEKAPILVEKIFAELPRLNVSQQTFNIYKRSLMAAYENQAKELPFIQSAEILANTLSSTSPLGSEKLDEIIAISYEEFVQFTKDIFSHAYVEGVLYGNLTEIEATNLWKTIHRDFGARAFPKEQHYTRQILNLPTDHGPYMIVQKTPMQGNAAILAIQQGKYSYEKRAAQQVLGRALKEGFFDTLRTKQQTGYIAKAWEKEEERHLFQFFAVQSNTHGPLELINRYELFLENFVKQFSTEMPQQRFENIRLGAIDTLEMIPENLSISGLRLFTLAFEQNAEFDLVKKRITALRQLTYEEVKEAAIEYFSRANPARLAVLIEGVTPKERDFRYKTVSKEQLLQQGRFVTWKD